MRSLLMLFIAALVATACTRTEDTMGLPRIRPRTYVVGMPIEPDDMNAIFDSIIAGIHGPRWRKLPAAAGHVVDGTILNGDSYEQYMPGAQFQGRAVGNRWVIPITLDEGERLLAAKGYVQCGGTDVLKMTVWRVEPDTLGATNLGNDSSTGHVSAIEDLDVVGLAEIMTMADRRTYFIEFEVTAFAASPFVWGAAIQTDYPEI